MDMEKENVYDEARVIQINPSETNFDVYSAMNIRSGADEVFRLIV